MLGVFNCKQGHITPKPNVKYAIVKAKRPVQTIIPHTLDQPTALHISLSELWLNPESWQALRGGDVPPLFEIGASHNAGNVMRRNFLLYSLLLNILKTSQTISLPYIASSL